MRFLIIALLSTLSSIESCSDFRYNSTPDDASILSGRTMDFVPDLETLIEIVPRGTSMQEPPIRGCANCPDYGWESKYGFVAMNVFGVNVATDGLNEKGLSAGWLYLTGSKYPIPEATEPDHEVSPFDPEASPKEIPVVTSTCTYFLGNFATVQEVKDAIKNHDIQIAAVDVSAVSILRAHTDAYSVDGSQLHVSVHDATGANLVLEFLDGKLRMYDNLNNVLTNDPPLQEQLKLLKEHGLKHLPGGYEPADRFQRLSLLNHAASVYGYKTLNNHDDVTYLQATKKQRQVSDVVHILNTVELPTLAATQWTLVHDHTDKALYFRSTMNFVLRKIDLSIIDFSHGQPRQAIPVTMGDWHVDLTPALVSTDNQLHTSDLPSRSQILALKKGETDASLKELVKTSYSSVEAKGSSSLRDLVLVLAGVVVGVAVTMIVAHRRTIQSKLFKKQSYQDIA